LFFKSEKLWIEFASSSDHAEFFKLNISTFECNIFQSSYNYPAVLKIVKLTFILGLYDSAVLANLKELASVLQKRIVIMKFQFVKSANSDNLL